MRVHLYRDSFDTAWGFRLQGGKDLNQPLVVQRVFSNTPAEGELQRGDILQSINGRDTSQFTHKQALDQIKFSGGQIELQVDRPTVTSVKPLNPQSPTRAPSNIPPVTSSPIVIPIKKKAPEKPKIVSSVPAMSVHPGHKPTKITMNKFGGGTTSFGSSYGNAPKPQPGRSPAPYSQPFSPHPQPAYQQPQPAYQQPQQTYQDRVDGTFSPTYQAPQPQYQMHTAPPQAQPQAIRTFGGHTYSPMGVPAVSPNQQQLQNQQTDVFIQHDELPEENYDYIPVSQRRQQFADKPEKPLPLKHTNKPPRPFKPQSSEYTKFGVDYSGVRGPGQQAPATAPKPRGPAASPTRHVPVPTRGDIDYSDGSAAWSNTLRSSNVPKPWELEQQEYIMPSEMERRGPQTQVSVKSPVKPPTAAPTQITVRSVSRTETTQQQQPKGQQKGQGDRDWNDSYVYRMIHGESKQTTRQAPATSPKPPKQPSPQPQQQTSYETYDPTYMENYGTSDF